MTRAIISQALPSPAHYNYPGVAIGQSVENAVQKLIEQGGIVDTLELEISYGDTEIRRFAAPDAPTRFDRTHWLRATMEKP